MNERFEIAGGTVVGREHAAAGRNNQDAYCWWSVPEALVAVVADGCGSGSHSEVGARIGARLVVEALRRHLPRLGAWPAEGVVEYARLDVLEGLRALAHGMGGDLAQAVGDYLLFTVVGAVVTEATAFVFTLGDGVTVVGGETDVVSFPGNEPPYLAYGLTGSARAEASSDALRFEVRRCLPARELGSLLIGTDGVVDLMRAAEQALPGRSETVGPLRQFWEEDRYFSNPANLARRLTLANRRGERIDWEGRRVERWHGLLPDDTTLVAIRRRKDPPLSRGEK